MDQCLCGFSSLSSGQKNMCFFRKNIHVCVNRASVYQSASDRLSSVFNSRCMSQLDKRPELRQSGMTRPTAKAGVWRQRNHECMKRWPFYLWGQQTQRREVYRACHQIICVLNDLRTCLSYLAEAHLGFFFLPFYPQLLQTFHGKLKRDFRSLLTHHDDP